MKKILCLTRNEYVKQLKKPSILVLLIVLSAILFFSPLFWAGIEKLNEVSMSGYDTPSERAENRREVAEYYQDTIVENPEEQSFFEIQITYFLTQAQAYEQLAQAGLTTLRDWRSSMINAYVEACGQVAEYEAHVKDRPFPAPSDSYHFMYGWTGDVQADAESYQIALQTRDENYREIVKNDYFGYIRQLRDNYRQEWDAAKQDLERLKATAAENDTEENLLAVENQEWVLRGYESEDARLSMILERQIAFDDSWKNKTLSLWEQNAVNMQHDYQLMSYAEFSQSGRQSGITYEEYRNSVLESRSKLTDEITLYCYSLEHDTPLYNVSDSVLDSARLLSSKSVGCLILVTLFGIILASGIVSKEFSSGTVRLLLIRPVKRWKILLSKYLMVLSLCLGLTLLTYGAYLLLPSVLLGGSDFANPYLYLVGETVFQVPFPLYLLGQVMITFLSVVFCVTFAFFLSTLSRNTALAAILSAGLAFSPLFCVILSLFHTTLMKILLWTPFFYVDLSYWVFGEESLLLSMFNGQMDAFAHPGVGMAWLVLLTIGMLVGSFTFFRKHDVKN